MFRLCSSAIRLLASSRVKLALGCALVLVLTTAETRASCGHYVRRMGAGFQPKHDSGQVELTDGAMSPHAAEASLRSRPCSGPECDGIPRGQTPQPISSPPVNSQERWAIEGIRPEDAAQAGSWQWFEAIVPIVSDGFYQVPERPPKA